MATTKHRRNLRFWVLTEYGDGSIAPCWVCGAELNCVTMTLDRHPVPGKWGGRYIRENTKPACVRCNSAHLGVRDGPRPDCLCHRPFTELGVALTDRVTA